MNPKKMVFGLIGAGGFAREVMPFTKVYIPNRYAHVPAGDIEVCFVETDPQQA